MQPLISIKQFKLILLVLVILLSAIFAISCFLNTYSADQSLIDFLNYSNQVSAIANKFDAYENFTPDTLFDNTTLKETSENIKMISAATLVEKLHLIATFQSYGEVIISNQYTSLTISAHTKKVITSDNLSFELSTLPQFKYTSDLPDVLLPIEDIAAAMEYVISEDEYGITISQPFQTKRLIVRSNSTIEKYGAVASAYGFDDYYVLQYATINDAMQAYDILSQDSNVISVDPDIMFFVESSEDLTEDDMSAEITATEETTYSYNSWGASDSYMRFKSYNNSLKSIYGLSNLNSPIVAVLDSGIDQTHPLFANRIAQNGYNFVDSNTSNYYDDNNHGTHVSGIIADLTLTNVQILPLKVIASNGEGPATAIVNAIEYAIQLKQNGQNIVALNMSFGSKTSISTSYYENAIKKALANDILSVVASGNDSSSADKIEPAKVASAITVGAIDSAKEHASFSNYGNCLDVVAPGVQINSSIPNNKYTYYSGTSMATPHVAALVASLYSIPNNSYSPESISTILLDNVQDLGTSGKDVYFGYGLARLPVLQAEKDPDAPEIPPSVYTIVASAGSGGHISPNGTFTVDEGSDLEFSFTPNADYSVSSITINGVQTSYSGNSYTLENITQNITISVAFTATSNSNYYRLTLSKTNGGDIILRSGQPIKVDTIQDNDLFTTVVLIAKRTNLAFSVSPYEWYQVESVMVDNVKRNVTSIMTKLITADTTIVCRFKRQQNAPPVEEEPPTDPDDNTNDDNNDPADDIGEPTDPNDDNNDPVDNIDEPTDPNDDNSDPVDDTDEPSDPNDDNSDPVDDIDEPSDPNDDNSDPVDDIDEPTGPNDDDSDPVDDTDEPTDPNDDDSDPTDDIGEPTDPVDPPDDNNENPENNNENPSDTNKENGSSNDTINRDNLIGDNGSEDTPSSLKPENGNNDIITEEGSAPLIESSSIITMLIVVVFGIITIIALICFYFARRSR
ncbi:MAG: S8 family serine peptidase [Christensenellaceae bacterium]|jgi:hypothetical protein|nr:S8 family serine peptidase [Christensenellaceae bacterium]